MTYAQRTIRLGGSTNSYFLALIPKENNLRPLIDFSPFLYVTLPAKL